MKPLTIILLTILLSVTNAAAEEVTIAIAANFTDVARILAKRFEQQTGHATRISYGSTGKLYSQIEHGAPFEVFLAADRARPQKAEKEGLAVTGSGFVYARGKLVLWSLKESLFEQGERYLNEGDFHHLALANPKTAPYGLAAQQVMQHLGILERTRPRLVRGDSIAQTFQFVATGNAEAGFVALAQIKAWPGENGSLWEIPESYYAPIDQAAVLLNKGRDNPAAYAFLDFLKSGEAKQVIQTYGYGVE
ncbi:MAG: molybdate ABC transporter substrate-binding protein [Candidatus Thiodiazotropha lotti]|uniref:Molybdate ABC transporter substrate-binding protein n=1 Tax=Candidatus Thiodiazotropha lotti TaxID=2792787 RepID=A0A9E4K2D0_9GAMM|nr:molybdate ABC transporter substrate-binding protein [Candidatus Thiodiazotropha lotti]ODC02153.1 molybdate ABC transporter substrate-binding protein [Candidatus Thiodiazotropha endoloripes]MCG7921526.1 molybdate ABC transporter substrate-binding protein [Candidatus Thiodiazotropha lotti]MCG7929479.1 molybdate ABC transporter substrate-binding protein [Candidatus Thiodiazotropha lotti]MCG7938092.1 molybdate ABC transporter substrate-binding protein [Candidatus Thiodiazotropha lotti]